MKTTFDKLSIGDKFVWDESHIDSIPVDVKVKLSDASYSYKNSDALVWCYYLGHTVFKVED